MTDPYVFQAICGDATIKAPSSLPESTKYVIDGNQPVVEF